MDDADGRLVPGMQEATSAPVRPSELLVVLRALADGTRLRIYLALRQRERCVREVVAAVGLPQPLVSHHLGVLMRAGLLRARRAEGYTLYALDAGGLAGAREAVAGLLDPTTLPEAACPGANDRCCRGEP